MAHLTHEEEWARRFFFFALVIIVFSIVGVFISLHFDHNDRKALRAPYHVETTTISVVPPGLDPATGDFIAITANNTILHSAAKQFPYHLDNKVDVFCAGTNCRQNLPSGHTSWTTVLSVVLIVVGGLAMFVSFLAWTG